MQCPFPQDQVLMRRAALCHDARAKLLQRCVGGTARSLLLSDSDMQRVASTLLKLALAVVVLLAGATIVLRRFAAVDTVDTMACLSLRSVSTAIERYSRDVGHLPASLTDLLSSNDPAWRGPYTFPSDLKFFGAVDLSYEIVDSSAPRYRIAIPAHFVGRSRELVPERSRERQVQAAPGRSSVDPC